MAEIHRRTERRRRSLLERRYAPLPPRPPEPELEPDSEPAGEQAAATEPDTGGTETQLDTLTIDFPHGVTVSSLEQAARTFRESGYNDHDQIKGWGDDDGVLRKVAAVRQYARGGITPPGIQPATIATGSGQGLVVNTVQRDVRAEVQRGILENLGRRAQVRDPRLHR